MIFISNASKPHSASKGGLVRALFFARGEKSRGGLVGDVFTCSVWYSKWAIHASAMEISTISKFCNRKVKLFPTPEFPLQDCGVKKVYKSKF